MERLDDLTSSLNGWIGALHELFYEIDRFQLICRRLPPIQIRRYSPRRPSRTKKKQRLTRLQRRHNRQRK